ncbi:MAG: dTDP-4-dehydrorhamnose reductase [Phenylobacterium sp.]|uniref:dTDP-4-dehydrorhamnose reductase n=1 Tax=Phenylobacterium sp. TaxID=1871053 RepID=UPI0026399338|nr:dTDP-4-dehydrorhamnose reductase [Phenylobacterium sp.]MDB5500005.1 dTDP-4-dehydrorhamnose reductase [Phenylobacterium sp.]
MTVRVLQFGTTGQLARELLAQAKDCDVEIIALSRADADFADPQALARALEGVSADLVIIAAAYTAVDLAESEEALAYRVNAEAPAAIAGVLGGRGAALVHISTDYVFDGAKGSPYVEADTPHPLNVYGASKLAGERQVLAACPRALVLRTSWVVSSHGKNFVKTMLRLAGEGGPIKVVDDQFGRPTSARDLARFILSQAARLARAPAGDAVFGLHHFANAGEVSWKGFAEGVFDLALGAAAPQVQAIATADRPAPAARPTRGTLDTGKLERVFGVTPRPWREALAEIVAELKAEQRSAA